MNKIISEKITDIARLCKLYQVRNLYAFGSVCTDHFNDKSDIDLLISFNNLSFGEYADNYFLLHWQFEELFKRKIDLLTDKSLSNPYFIQSLEQTKTLIYEA